MAGSFGIRQSYVKLVLGAVAVYVVVYVVNMRRFHNQRFTLTERSSLTFNVDVEDWKTTPVPILKYPNKTSVFDINMVLSPRTETSGTSTSNSTSQKTPMWISFAHRMRLGNQMFQLASTFGIARSYPAGTWKMCISPNATYLLNGFPAVAALPHCDPENLPSPKSRTIEKKYGTFDDRLLHMETNQSMLVGFYFQSWKYFQNHSTEIRQLLRFFPAVIDRARKTLTESVEEYFKCKNCFSEVITIGVHIRRGDMLYLESRGHQVAAEGYLARAMQYLDRVLNVTSQTKRVFVVSSDDIWWCRKNIQSKDLIFATGMNQYVDMAMLSMCQHTIMTVGTFGWWTGWLAGGITVYYRHNLVPGSQVEGDMSHEDHFRPNWIDMT